MWDADDCLYFSCDDRDLMGVFIEPADAVLGVRSGQHRGVGLPEAGVDGSLPRQPHLVEPSWPDGSEQIIQAAWGQPKQATILSGISAERLNPCDAVRSADGKTTKVIRVRPHETDSRHVYVDTESGTSMVARNSTFDVVPFNSMQQSTPGYGTPGGNSNYQPWSGTDTPDNSARGSGESKSECPVCRTPGSLYRQGDHYSCNKCGYREQFGGAGDNTFSDASHIVQKFDNNTIDNRRIFWTINGDQRSAIARRAQQVLDQKETS